MKEETIRCKSCDLDRPIGDFYVWKTGYRRKICTECKRLKAAKYREENRELTNLTARESHRRAKKERPKSFFVYRAKQRAKKLGLPFNIDESDIVIPEFCPVLGIRLNSGGGDKEDSCPSIDRVIPEMGYIKGNVKIISKRANTIKSFGTISDHEKIIEYIKSCQATSVSTP